MAGFFGASRTQRDAGTAVVAVHEEIDAALSESGLAAIKKCTVGDRVTCDGVPLAPAKLASPALYHEVTSRLDKVIARAPIPMQIDPNTPPVTDALDNARMTLLVTDGMEVATDPGGAGSCASGADPTCIVTLVRQRIADGFGVWIVGVLLPFNGTQFPERTLTAAYFAEARAHVDQLKFDPRNLGVTFAIPGGLGSDPTSGGKSTYTYQGYKPLLIFAFSREPALARRVVDRLVHKLRTAPIHPGKMTPDDAVQSVELAPLAATTTRITKIERVPEPTQRAMFGDKFDPSQLEELKLQDTQLFDGNVSQKIWCGARGRSMLYVDYEQDRDRSLPAYLKEQVALVAPANAPDRSVAPPQPAVDGRIQTGLSCDRLPAGPNTPLALALETRISLDGAASAQQWWSHDRWSATDAWKMPERAYGLEALVLSILQDRLSRASPWNRAVLHVARDPD